MSDGRGRPTGHGEASRSQPAAGSTPTGRVVVGGANHWGGPVTTGSQQYARLFAEHGWQVAYLSAPISPFHLLWPKSWLYNRHKFGLWARGGRRYLDGRIFSYNPFSLLPIFNAPLLRSRLALDRSLDLSVPRLTRVLEREGFDRPDVFWIEHLTFEGLLDRVDARRSVYRMADEPELFPEPYPPGLLRRLPGLLRRVDLVVTTARRLEARAREHRDHGVLYLPNGVDYDHFAATRPEPTELATIPRPRVLYVGSLEPWFDTELVARAARAHPSFSFVIIGPERILVGELRALENVHVLGQRPYVAVPGYMAHADVGVIPFRRGGAIRAVHPIKVYEYLAAGLPVVATDWEELAAMDAPIVRTRSPDAFIDAVAAAIAGPGDPAPRRAYARSNAWSARFETVRRALNELDGP